MACHICKRTGIRECNPEYASIKCEICGFCKCQELREAMKETKKETPCT